MTKVRARIPVGKTVFVRDIELYTVKEAKRILADKDWEMGGDIFSAEQPNKQIGWLAVYPNHDGIYVEVM